MKVLHEILHDMRCIMFHGLLKFFLSSHLKKGGSNTKLTKYDTLRSHDPSFIIKYYMEGDT